MVWLNPVSPMIMNKEVFVAMLQDNGSKNKRGYWRLILRIYEMFISFQTSLISLNIFKKSSNDNDKCYNFVQFFRGKRWLKERDFTVTSLFVSFSSVLRNRKILISDFNKTLQSHLSISVCFLGHTELKIYIQY